MSDPLRLDTDCEVDNFTGASPSLEKDQPEGATEETKKRGIYDRQRPKPIRKISACDKRVSQERQYDRDPETYKP